MGRNLIRTTCLSGNDNVTTISSGVCGNGIVEPGEECDCGGPEGCGANSRCCDPTTCRFTQGAVCDPSNDGCCTSQCQISSRGSVCRSSIGPCDPEEVCSGSSASCPADVSLPDGQSCSQNGSNGTTCASGQCTSRSKQCSLALFNSTGESGSISACDNSCQMNCWSSSSRSTCEITGADFLDGTPCGSSGTSLCYNGDCRAPGGGAGESSSSSWIDRHTAAFIVIIVIGTLAVLLAAGCCFFFIRRRARGRKAQASQARLAALQGRNVYSGPGQMQMFPSAPGQTPLQFSNAPPTGFYNRPPPPPPPLSSGLPRSTSFSNRYA
jgi:hypothetical protein